MGTIKHIIMWNKWRKRNLNSKTTKILVLFKIISTPTFEGFKIDYYNGKKLEKENIKQGW